MPALTVAILSMEQREFISQGFCGGRTEPFKLYYEVDEDKKEEVHYYDVRSLYPWVNATSQYPVGHPQWWTPNASTDTTIQDDWIGWIQVDVEPPDDLYLPVLPQRKDGKLMFDLLPKKAAVYFLPELRKAIEKGYRVTRIYKMLQFPRQTDTLFKSYVMTMFKIKVMTSREWCKLGSIDLVRGKVEDRNLIPACYFCIYFCSVWRADGASWVPKRVTWRINAGSRRCMNNSTASTYPR